MESHNTIQVLDQFFKPTFDIAWKTPRSGLRVVLKPVENPDVGETNVKVKIDGPVDRYDAEQLAGFFKQLGERLRKEANNDF